MSVLQKSVIRLSSSLLTLAVVLPAALEAQDRTPSHNCDMAAVITHARAVENCLIAQMPNVPGDFNDPEDFFYDFIIDRSSPGTNDDGYRVVFYADDELTLPPGQLSGSDYRSPHYYVADPGPLNDARHDIMNEEYEAVIALAHSRNGTGGLSGGNHPFTFAGEDRTWTFMHNGGIKDEGDLPDIKYALWYDLYYNSGGQNGSWFEDHPSNWVSPANVGNYSEFIDSELLFHWIMKSILAEGGDVLAGLHEALTGEVPDPVGGGDINLYSQFMQNYHTTNRINFVLCDGEALYAFRNTPWDWGHHELSYEVFDVEGGFVAVKTQTPLEHRLPQFTLAYLPRFGSPVEFPNFHLGYADTHIVPTEYLTIQGAIDASSNGDVVLVQPGIYAENIDFGGRAITVRSDGDGDPETVDLMPVVTIIDGGQLDTTVTFQSQETRLSRLEGFRIQNGDDRTGAYKFGGGVWCWQFSCPTLINNVIMENRAKYGGGISCLDQSSPLIAWNVIRFNIADSSGGGLHLGRSRATITHNKIEMNEGGATTTTAQGGGLGFKECDLKIVNNFIAWNSNTFGHGGAISSNSSNVVMTSNTVCDNRDSGQTCDGIYIYNQSTLAVYNTILWGNSSNLPYEVVLESGSCAGFQYSNVEGGFGAVFVGPGCIAGWDYSSMIDEDPLFQGGGFYLSAFSPCIDRGWNRAPGLPELDLTWEPRCMDGPDPAPVDYIISLFARTDIGADEYPGPTWDYSCLDAF